MEGPRLEAERFDAISRTLAAGATRRGALGLLSGLPLIGGLMALLDACEVDAKGRRKRRKKAPQAWPRAKTAHTHHKKQCKAELARQDLCREVRASARTTARNRSIVGRVPVIRRVQSCQVCNTVTATCAPDQGQLGQPCGNPGQVCQSDGTCACSSDPDTCPSCTTCGGDGTCQGCTGCCDGDACVTDCGACRTCEQGQCGGCPGCCDGNGACQPGTENAVCGANGSSCQACSNPTPICANQVCVACTSGDQCPANTICDEGACLACDVCSACTFTTVQAAIDAASTGDTIRICAGTYVGNVTVNKNLTLIGAGDGATAASDTLLDAAGSGRVVQVNSGVTATLRSLRLTGGNLSGNTGGGMNNFGTVTLLSCTVTGNRADLNGGGIFNFGTLALSGCTVSNNTTGSSGGGIDNNGASVGTVTLTGCQISGNTAQVGGGLDNFNGGTVTIDSTSITGNTATQAGGGGGVRNNSGTATLQNGSTVTGNTPDNCVGMITGTGCDA